MAGITFPTLLQPEKLGRVHFLVRAFFLACSFAVCSHDMSLVSTQGEKERKAASSGVSFHKDANPME